MHLRRRAFVATGLAGLVASSRAQTAGRPAKAAEAVWPELRIVIPANPGGGWDQTGRAFGGALQSAGLVARVDYENIGGKAGTVGLAQFVERYSATPRTLLVGGMVMLGGIALQRPAVDLGRVTPVAKLTSDYLVVAVPAASPLKSARDLLARMGTPEHKATVVGGSAGGVDHMLLGMMLRATNAVPDNYGYLPTSSGADAVRALVDGKAQWGISGYSEFKPAIESGAIRALAIS
jgi:putative tricarboxylic transport membrane protein